MSPSASYNLPDLSGQFIDDGCLELLCLIGSGAYGKVYKAFDHDDEQYYAVKCMPKYEAGSRGERSQETELLAHGMLSGHPRVISLHHIIPTDKYVFAILELATGGDFFTALVDKQLYRGNIELIKRVFGELLDAVEYIHRNSVYHRDIKPENFLCDAEGTNIKLADFGLATQISVSRQFGCGTRSYMSPESINLDDVYECYSARHSDMWALSIIFTNMISGYIPWNSAELSDAGFAAFLKNPEYLSKALRLSQPAFLLLKRCFNMNPLKRPMLSEFRQAINSMDCFTTPQIQPLVSSHVSPLPCLPVQDLPVAVSSTLEWAVATPSNAANGETPRHAAPAAFPARLTASQIRFSSFLGSSSSCSSSSVLPYLPASSLPPPPSSSSSLPSSVFESDSSTLASTTCSTSLTSPTPSDAGADLIINISFPAPPQPVYLRPSTRPLIGKLAPPCFIPQPINLKYVTVAQNARPSLPTMRQFLLLKKSKNVNACR